jgi:hypothetical protein
MLNDPPQDLQQMGAPEQVPLYSLALAQAPVEQIVPQTQESGGLLTKKVGPLPVWAWGLIGLGFGGTGYLFYRGQKNAVKENGEDEGEGPKIGEIISKAFSGGPAERSSSWEPSRSVFAGQLEKYFQRKDQSQHVKIWHDAEDAKKNGMKFTSPLVNIQVKHGGVKLDQALTRFCRREGLNPTSHPDGSIGLYPHASSKRGKEWEEYIDALRDDGQEI